MGFSRILVTGGAGFIGAHFVEHLLDSRVECVVVLDALTYAAGPLPPALTGDARCTFVHGDINDGPLVAKLLHEHSIDAVVHMAAESHVDRSIEAPATFLQTNTVGTFCLLETVTEYSRRLRRSLRFVHVSTDEVFGSVSAPGTSDEDAPYRPNSPYSASKAAADAFVRSYCCTYGLDTVTVRFCNVYGARQFPEKLIPLMALRAREGETLPLYGDGEYERDWLHVSDACRAAGLVLAQGATGESYNVATGLQRSNLEVVGRIRDLVGRGEIEPVADRPGHDRRYAMSAAKIQRQLGWKPSVPFEVGLATTVRWYAENPAWVQKVLSGEYRLERLGLSRSR